jgi:hypothetical protein
MMSYLVRTLQAGDESGRVLFQRMTDNAERYLEDAVRAGTIKESRDPKARARFLAMCGGGGFLLYLHMHDDPHDMGAVLRDYAREMIMPALEVYPPRIDGRRHDVRRIRGRRPAALTLIAPLLSKTRLPTQGRKSLPMVPFSSRAAECRFPTLVA